MEQWWATGKWATGGVRQVGIRPEDPLRRGGRGDAGREGRQGRDRWSVADQPRVDLPVDQVDVQRRGGDGTDRPGGRPPAVAGLDTRRRADHRASENPRTASRARQGPLRRSGPGQITGRRRSRSIGDIRCERRVGVRLVGLLGCRPGVGRVHDPRRGLRLPPLPLPHEGAGRPDSPLGMIGFEEIAADTRVRVRWLSVVIEIETTVVAVSRKPARRAGRYARIPAPGQRRWRVSSERPECPG